jgi:signal peptidase I
VKAVTKADLIAETKDEGTSLSAPVIMELIEAVHEKGAPFRFPARGYSMTPAIRDGDTITVSPLKGMTPGRGDVIAFRHPNQLQLLVHRVLKKSGNRFLMKGDNCPVSDGWIPVENLLGIITRVERQGKDRFWPNRSEPDFCSTIYLFIYPAWPPVRRVIFKSIRRLRKMICPGKGY